MEPPAQPSGAPVRPRRAQRCWPVLVAAALALAACDLATSPLEQARRLGTLVVVTRNGSTTYFEGRDGPEGYEYELTRAFAAYLGLDVRYEVRDSIPEVLDAIRRGEGHVAAAALTRTAERETRYRFGPDYKEVRQQVVCGRDGPRPRGPADLAGVDLLVLAGSSYEERLRELRKEHPALAWRTTDELSTDEILERVARGDVDCAIADSNLVAINRRYFPDLSVAFPISEAQQLAWVLPRAADELARALAQWMRIARSSGFLDRLAERFYGHTRAFDYVDLKRFHDRRRTRLPRYRALFRESAQEFGLPWKLLAALSYQESHWNPKARSPTGVRGMMMLTRVTAKSLGVRDRLDAAQSIRGGARYLVRMLERIPAEVQGPDRLWFALAAYNVGYGHLRDARELARRLGKDPDRWHSLKSVLPLLSRKKYYRTLEHGYARGHEPVQFVERVRGYLDLLERGTEPDAPLAS